MTSSPKPINFYNHYLASLPKEYDSLLNWSEVEIRSFLVGTALGVAALQDPCSSSASDAKVNDGAEKLQTEDHHDRALHDRFQRTVVPYLRFLKGNGFFLEVNADDSTNTTNCKNDIDEMNCEAKNPKRQKLDTTTCDKKDGEMTCQIEQLYPLFREGCMCISTRAFHMQSPNDNNSKSKSNNGTKENEAYEGPFLLPYIDLLNHSPHGSSKHVTTLRRDPDGSFVMVAERDIAVDEEICHSYDSGAATDDVCNNADGSPIMPEETSNKESRSSLNSAQLLQTFGFVDTDVAGKRLLGYYKEKDDLGNNVTPAVLTKSDISDACKKLASSSYPDTVRKFMDQTGMLDEGWEYWQMPKIEDSTSRRELLTSFSEELIIPFGASLSEELITICCLHFLPDDAINDLLDESNTSNGTNKSHPSLLLGSEVLEDYFLGKLVLQTILNALKEKFNAYEVSSASLLAGCKQNDLTRSFLNILGGLYNGSESKIDAFSWGKSEVGDATVLLKLASLQEGRYSDLLHKFRCGVVISLEERACLLELKKKTLDMFVQLDS